ncbi:DUF3147 family protein [Sphaerisporangium fuscum]|uniref:DUF3147 family protein n=1 Tax=Sphaerisporangium fuscum TaxID=2835868 RepID=UPI001BDD8416|nr:DUF3147 family protein [Sphaerisporangium fuscum]
MSQVLLIAVRGVFGGLLVMAFAMIGELVTPKRFAGIFAAGPSVALAGMIVTALHSGDRTLSESALGMIVGSVALVVYCAVAVPLVRRLGAIAGSAVAVSVWAAVAGAGWLLIA